MRQIDLDMPETDNYSGPYNVTSLRVPAGTGSGGGGGSNIYEKILRIGEKISLTIRSKKSPLFYTSSGNNGSSISRASTMVNAMNAPMPSPEKLGNCYIPIPGGPNPNHPYSSNPSSNTGNTNTNTSNNGQVNPVSFTTSKHCKQVRRTIQRILLYPVEIILFRLPYIIVMLSMVDENAGYITNTLISIHGIFNFAIFLINPGLEEFWFWFNSTIFGRHAKLQAQPVKFKPGC
ncbi:hypothetical protein H4219_005762 [Mycoemilia scoparia]|uniref:Uncharacterized protein n=1 Tax=Mycoemilia scoparia TaxID=417184 RepID=A0A9W8DPF5_9FUNG|nr:hypothetical protein H4219_005762 [Mycoemilia scoparia]